MFRWGCQRRTNSAVDKVRREGFVVVSPFLLLSRHIHRMGRALVCATWWLDIHNNMLPVLSKFKKPFYVGCLFFFFFKLWVFFGISVIQWLLQGWGDLVSALTTFSASLNLNCCKVTLFGAFLFLPRAKELLLIYEADCIAVGVKQVSQILLMYSTPPRFACEFVSYKTSCHPFRANAA